MLKKCIKVTLTNKGLAVIAAVETGLLPKVEGGWDDTEFNRFWERYEQLLAESRDKHCGKRDNS